MKESTFIVTSNRRLTSDVFELVLSGDTSDFTAPGQFVEISIPGLFLRRPISVCDWSHDTLTLLIRVVGSGTAFLCDAQKGTSLSLITGLGNGFCLSSVPTDTTPLLVGGGIGIAPLFALAKQLTKEGVQPRIILGFRNKGDIFYLDEFRAISPNTIVTTEDGSYGIKGFVTNAVEQDPALFYALACGPVPMLKAVATLPQITGGQFSLEARMGCGFGACVGCTISTISGPKRVCVEGPVFAKGDIQW